MDPTDSMDPTDPPDPPRWYALRTRARHEKQVRDRLASQGIEPFLPTVIRVSRWKDRKKRVEWPLFSGYCFARFHGAQRLAVLQVPGVVQVVGSASGRPEPIPDEEIEALRRLMTTTLAIDPFPHLQEGMAVEVVRGPLQGVRGTLLRKATQYRLILGVSLIQQGASVEIDIDDVTPIDEPSP